VISLTDDPNSTAKDLNDVIIQDQSLTASVLRLANSAYYGFPRRISTVTEAIVLLGFSAIRGLVLAASVQDVMNKEMSGYALESGELWHHSYACGMGSRIIAKRIKMPADQAFTAGLLHDIGKLVLNYFMQESYQEVKRRVDQDKVPFMTAEAAVLGFDHAAVGARVAEAWNLPAELAEPIAYHHQPMTAPNQRRLASVVHVADAICMIMGIGLGADGLNYPLDPLALQTLGLDQEAVEQIMSQLADGLVDLPLVAGGSR